MQWLIDLVIEAIGIPPVFIDRGDPAVPDFPVGSFIIDNAWHDLDLSGIVPATASAVLLAIEIASINAASQVILRKKGNINHINISQILTQVGGFLISGDFVCPIGSDGLLEYQIPPNPWIFLNVTVKGWWL